MTRGSVSWLSSSPLRLTNHCSTLPTLRIKIFAELDSRCAGGGGSDVPTPIKPCCTAATCCSWTLSFTQQQKQAALRSRRKALGALIVATVYTGTPTRHSRLFGTWWRLSAEPDVPRAPREMGLLLLQLSGQTCCTRDHVSSQFVVLNKYLESLRPCRVYEMRCSIVVHQYI